MYSQRIVFAILSGDGRTTSSGARSRRSRVRRGSGEQVAGGLGHKRSSGREVTLSLGQRRGCGKEVRLGLGQRRGCGREVTLGLGQRRGCGREITLGLGQRRGSGESRSPKPAPAKSASLLGLRKPRSSLWFASLFIQKVVHAGDDRS